jgi:hypothetical protein
MQQQVTAGFVPLITPEKAAKYEYYVVDIVTNKVLAQIPFQDVTFERTLKGSGSFDGMVPVNPQTMKLDLYNSLLPGKSALYVLRDGVCVWGGIIWGRTYDLFGRTLSISGSEFTSYLKHRVIWKTYSYQFDATLTKKHKNDNVKVTFKYRKLAVPLSLTDEYGDLTRVHVAFTDMDLIQYGTPYTDQYYNLTSDAAPTQDTFYISMPDLPARDTVFDHVTVILRVDTYEYLRGLLNEAMIDFVDTQFANETITPGYKHGYNVTSFMSTSGITTLTTDNTHDIIPGQQVELHNIATKLDGKFTVYDVPSPTSFSVTTPSYTVSAVSIANNLATVNVLTTSITNNIFKYNVGQYVKISGISLIGGVNVNSTNVAIQSIDNNSFTFKLPSRTLSITSVSQTSANVTYFCNNSSSLIGVGANVVVSGTVSKANDYDGTYTVVAANTTSVTVSNPAPNLDSDMYIDSGEIYPVLSVATTATSGTVSDTDVATISVSSTKFPVLNRQITLTEPINIKSLKRVKTANKQDWIITVVTEKSFPFNKNDTITVTLDSNNTKSTNYDTGTDGVILISADPATKTLAYKVPGSYKTTLKANSTSDYLADDTSPYVIKNPSNKYTVAYATPRETLQLGLKSLATANTGNYISVMGVDDISWVAPIYNGYQTVTAVSNADNSSTSILNYVTYFQISGTSATIYTPTNSGFDEGDYVTISNFNSTYNYLNGKFKVEIANQDALNGESSFTITLAADHGTVAKTWAPDQGTSSSVKPRVVADGKSTVIYDVPAWSNLLTFGEPNAGSSISKYKYKGASGSNPAIVTITTALNHYLNPGDTVKIDANLDDLDGTYKVDSVSTNDTFTYKIPASKKPKAKDLATEKFKAASGTVDRIISKVGTLPRNQLTISGISSVNNLVTAYSPNHNLAAKQKILLAYDPTTSQSPYDVYENAGVATSILNVTDNTFSYLIDTVEQYEVTNVTATGSIITITAPASFTSGQLVSISGVTSSAYNLSNKAISGFANITANIQSATANGSAITYTFTGGTNTPFYAGDYVTVSNTTPSGFSLGPVKISAANATSFTVLSNVTGSYTSGGTAATTRVTIANAATGSFSTATTGYIYSAAAPDYGSTTVNVVAISNVITSNNMTIQAKFTTTAAHNYIAGASVSVTGIQKLSGGGHTSYVNGFYPIVNVTSNTFTVNVAYDTKSNLLNSTVTYLANTATTALAISTADITTGNGYAFVNNNAGTNSKDITQVNSITKLASPANTYEVVVTCPYHTFKPTDLALIWIPLKKWKDLNNNNEEVTITAVNTSDPANSTFTYRYIQAAPTTQVLANPTPLSVLGTAAFAPYIYKPPVVISRTYGEFPANANLGGITFSTTQYSKKFYPAEVIRGSDLQNLGDHLEQYSNNVNGFDYRIDCSVDYDSNGNKIFKRTFVIVPITPITYTEYLATLPYNKLAPGQYAPPSAFGATRLSFEHPGNIENITLSETAENSATRMFIVGDNNDLGATASAIYSAAADNDLLKAGWPLLDRSEKVTWPIYSNVLSYTPNIDNWGNYDSEADFYLTAQRYLYESKPPQGDFIVRVDGSLSPIIGTYNPGDWCQIVVNDESGYINARLNSVLEPRHDVIVRKIDNIKVSVPNSPAFPEEIDLTLVTDWQVDKIGK